MYRSANHYDFFFHKEHYDEMSMMRHTLKNELKKNLDTAIHINVN